MGDVETRTLRERPAPARPAATLLPLRDRGGVEVLMLRRRADSRFAADRWVFPGGAVDAADRCPPEPVCPLRDGGLLADRLRVSHERVVGWHLAAVRETFEESGLLLARPGDGGSLPGPVACERMRGDLVDGRADATAFVRWLAEHRLAVEPSDMVPISRWVTPRASPRRFDVLFFAAAAPSAQEAVSDMQEITDLRWVRPAEAVAAGRGGEMALMLPTLHMLGLIAEAADVAAALHVLRSGQPIKPVLPHRVTAGDGARSQIYPGDHGYPHEPYAEEFPEWT